MKSNPVQYTESHNLSPNVFLVFYVYVTLMLIVANIAPVSATGYFIFFILGLTGLCLLFISAAYKIIIRKNILEVSIKLFIRIVFQRLDIKEIESVEEVKINDLNSSIPIEKTLGGISRLIKIPKAIKVNMPGKKSYIISTANPDQLVNLVKSINK